MRLVITLIIGTIGWISMMPPALASDADKKALANAQQLLRQVAAEKDRLKAENERLQTEAESSKRQYEGLRSKSAQALNKSNEINLDLNAKLKETVQLAVELETQKKNLEERLANEVQERGVCVSKNIKLYQTNKELLSQYEEKGVMASLLQLEPVTGLSRVAVENLVQEYQDKLDGLKAKPQTADTPAPVDSIGSVVKSGNTVKPELTAKGDPMTDPTPVP